MSLSTVVRLQNLKNYIDHRKSNPSFRLQAAQKQRTESSILFETTKDEGTKRVVLPYLQQTTKQLSRMYRDCDFQVVNRNVYSLQKLIGSAKDKIPDSVKSGIYEIGCQIDCDDAYYGKTERNPKVRYGEHEYCIAKRDMSSAVARHMVENKHMTDISKVKLVQPVHGRNTIV